MNFSKYFNYENGSITYGLTNELIAFFVVELFKKKQENIILLTSNLYEGNKAFNAIKNHSRSYFYFCFYFNCYYCISNRNITLESYSSICFYYCSCIFCIFKIKKTNTKCIRF